MPEQKFFWIGLAAALIAGLSLGLTYAWLINPVEYYDSDPLDLRTDLREDYVVLVALSYSLNGDLAQTQTRLSFFGDGLRGQLFLALALLAHDLGVQSEAAVAHLPTNTPTVTPTPTITSTPLPTTPPTATPTTVPTPTSTLQATSTPDARPPYRLVEQRQVCSDSDGAGLIQIYVQDAEGQGLPNVEVQVSWEGGQDRFFSGLKPEIDPGYTDFQMSPGTVYDVVVWGMQTGDISTEGCAAGVASWHLVFRRRE